MRDSGENFDLAHVYSGARVVVVSDQHFGVGSNLLLPGRGEKTDRFSVNMLLTYPPSLLGKDMGDGWETKRSRTKDHKDWVIVKLCVVVWPRRVPIGD